jgi:hypothetical protein
MRDLELALQVPTKVRDDDAAELFRALLSLSKASTFFTLIIHGKNMPIEKVRDDIPRAVLLDSAAPYCLSVPEEGNFGHHIGCTCQRKEGLPYQIGKERAAGRQVHTAWTGG